MRNENKNKLENLLSAMTLEEKVGQMFQVGFTGIEVTSGIKEMIEDYYVGGIIYFKRNIKSLEQISNLSNELQILSRNKRIGLPLLMSTDQEGGMVNRLTGGTHFPGNMVLGAARKSSLAEKAGRAVARQIKAVGINMNFAPVLDQVLPGITTFLVIYDYSPFNLKVASEIIAGRYKAREVLPVTLKI